VACGNQLRQLPNARRRTIPARVAAEWNAAHVRPQPSRSEDKQEGGNPNRKRADLTLATICRVGKTRRHGAGARPGMHHRLRSAACANLPARPNARRRRTPGVVANDCNAAHRRRRRTAVLALVERNRVVVTLKRHNVGNRDAMRARPAISRPRRGCANDSANKTGVSRRRR
jgi:hypothetical protein